MKQSVKDARKLAKIAAQLANIGVTVDVEAIQEQAKIPVQTESDKLEATLHSVSRPGDFTYRLCKRCHQPFGSNYRAVAYCSDLHRIRDFEDLTGVKWNSTKTPEQRWGGEPPLVIPPDVVYTMWKYATSLVQYAETQGWVLPDGFLDPEFLNQSATELNQPDPNLSELNQDENGLTISLLRPDQTMNFVIRDLTGLDDVD